MLRRTGLTAERFSAVDARYVKRMALERAKEREANERKGWDLRTPEERSMVRGYENAGRYALALTQRLAIRRARMRGAEAVLLLEDDVIFHPNLRALLEMVEPPEDWGIFYLGCGLIESPEPAAPGILRVGAGQTADTHAVAIHSRYFDQVIEGLDAFNKPDPGFPLASDRFLAALHEEIPSYACFPNLAWQAEAQSDLKGEHYSLYRKGGTQSYQDAVVERTYEKMFAGGETQRGPARSRLGLLFLTRGDVDHPGIWREFVEGAPERVRVFSHPKDLEALTGGFLEGTVIAENHETEWGGISLVRASLALLRAALEDETLTHFMLLSESCVPTRPLAAMLRHLDWNPKPRFLCHTLDQVTTQQLARTAALPEVPTDCWRFQSQWWLLDRIAAEWVARADYTDVFARMRVPDESYFATVLGLLGYPVDATGARVRP
jgi:hypothetical protein